MSTLTGHPAIRAAHVGRETTTEAFGVTWSFTRWTRAVWVKFAAWAKDFLPDPIEEVIKHIDKLAVKDAEVIRQVRLADQAEMAKAAAEGRPPVLLAAGYKEMASEFREKAIEQATCYLSFDSRQMASLTRSVPGASQLFYLLLKPNHPELTEDDAYEILIAVGQAEVDRIFETVSGRSAAAKNAGSQAA